MSRNKPKAEKAPVPMDPSVIENTTAAPATNRHRVCYAIETLVAEVTELFPETTVEYSNYNGRNTALDVTFDLSMLDADTSRVDLCNLLALLPGDERVADVLLDPVQDALAVVSMRPNPRTQDSRAPFGMGDALLVLAEQADEGFFVTEDDEDFFNGGGSQ